MSDEQTIPERLEGAVATTFKPGDDPPEPLDPTFHQTVLSMDGSAADAESTVPPAADVPSGSSEDLPADAPSQLADAPSVSLSISDEAPPPGEDSAAPGDEASSAFLDSETPVLPPFQSDGPPTPPVDSEEDAWDTPERDVGTDAESAPPGEAPPEETPSEDAAAEEPAPNGGETEAGDAFAAGGFDFGAPPAGDPPETGGDAAAESGVSSEDEAPPAEEGAGSDVPNDESPAEEPGGDTPADDASDETPSDDARSDETTSEDTPSDESSSEDAPGPSDEDGDEQAAASGDDPGGESEESEAPASGEPELPAHLALPSIDFSMPSFDNPLGADAQEGGDAASAASDEASVSTDGAPGDVPAHLQLPSFPELGLGDSNEAEAEGDDVDLGGTEDDAQAPAADDGPAHLAPPPMPAGAPALPPLGGEQQAPADPMAGPDLPGLPNFGLPDVVAQETPKKELTLLGDDKAAELALKLKSKRSMGGMIAIGIILVVLVGGAAIAAIGPDKVLVMAGLSEEPGPVEVERTPAEKAKAALAAGLVAYKNKKIGVAIEKYEEALEHDPKLGIAHRNLGVAFATKKKEAKAIKHYKMYLELVPDASDAKEVDTIIKDYEKAKGGSEKEPEQASKRRRRRR